MSNHERENEQPWFVKCPINEVAAILQEQIGQRLIAFSLGEKDPTKIGASITAKLTVS